MRLTDRLVEVGQRAWQEAGAIPLGDREQGGLDVEVPVVVPALPVAETSEVRELRVSAREDLVEALDLLLVAWLSLS